MISHLCRLNSGKCRGASGSAVRGALTSAVVAAVLLGGCLGGLAGKAALAADCCAVKAQYETAKRDADKADEAYKKHPEPDWNHFPSQYDLMVNQVRDELAASGPLLAAMTKDLAQLKSKRRSVTTHLSLAQAQANASAANKAYQAAYEANLGVGRSAERVKKLDTEIEQLTNELQKLQLNPKMPDKVTLQKIHLHKAALARNEKSLLALTGSNQVAVARNRINSPEYKSFVSPEIHDADLMYGPGEKKDEAIEGARYKARTYLEAWDESKKFLSQHRDSQALVAQRDELQKQLENKTAEKARLGQQKSAANLEEQRAKVAIAQNALIELQQDQEIRNLEATVTTVRSWAAVRSKKEAAEAKVETLSRQYNQALIQKDRLKENAQATLQVSQNRLNRIKLLHRGGESQPDANYFKKVNLELLQARATNERVLLALSDFDCFPDVRALMDRIRDQMNQFDQEKERLAAEAAKPRPAAKPRLAKRPPTRTTPRSTRSKPAKNVVLWVCDGPKVQNSVGVTIAGNTVTYTKVVGDATGVGTITWGAIPLTLEEGQEVTLSMTASGATPVYAYGKFNLNCYGEYSMWDNYAVSHPEADTSSATPNAKIVFKFKPQNEPYIQVVASDSSSQGSYHGTGIIYVYHRKN